MCEVDNVPIWYAVILSFYKRLKTDLRYLQPPPPHPSSNHPIRRHFRLTFIILLHLSFCCCPAIIIELKSIEQRLYCCVVMSPWPTIQHIYRRHCLALIPFLATLCVYINWRSCYISAPLKLNCCDEGKVCTANEVMPEENQRRRHTGWQGPGLLMLASYLFECNCAFEMEILCNCWLVKVYLFA